MKIVFMGTPVFAAVILEELLKDGVHEVCAVVTVPDKAVGRGLKLTPSDVKQVAVKYGIPVLQPSRLRDEDFLRQLEAYAADMFLVIAFRMLPEVVWKMPSKGTVNLHASLLPRYRGAAPIQRAIMNGDTETGVTTFFINEHIDEGNILLTKTHAISREETAGELHDALLSLGTDAVKESLKLIEEGGYTLRCQGEVDGSVPSAPKIFKEDCRICWNRPAEEIYNQIRGLSPYPGAFTMVKKAGEQESVLLKIFKARIVSSSSGRPGCVHSDGRHQLCIVAADACIQVEELQLFGKRRMAVKDFLMGNRGFDEAECDSEQR